LKSSVKEPVDKRTII